MSNKPRPLFTDEEVDASYPNGKMKLSRWDIHTIYEAARAKDAELIQRLVDALYGLQFDEANVIPAYNKADAAIAAAEAAGFKPSEP
jgi:hypothetical protein